MKLRNSLFALVTFLTAQPALARSIMAEYRFINVRTNQNYHTSLKRVFDAPVIGSRLTIFQGGAYCRLQVTRVEYTTAASENLKTAIERGGGEWHVPDNRVFALDVYFRQTQYDDVDCELKIYSEDGGIVPTPPTVPKPAFDCHYLGGHGTPNEVGNWYRINLPLIQSDFEHTQVYRDGLVRMLNTSPTRVACYTNCVWGQSLSCRDLLKGGDYQLESYLRKTATDYVPAGYGEAKVFGGFSRAEDTANSF